MPMEQREDVVIVGAGVIGLASALALLESGRSVRVIDSGRVGGGSSHGRSPEYRTTCPNNAYSRRFFSPPFSTHTENPGAFAAAYSTSVNSTGKYPCKFRSMYAVSYRCRRRLQTNTRKLPKSHASRPLIVVHTQIGFFSPPSTTDPSA